MQFSHSLRVKWCWFSERRPKILSKTDFTSCLTYFEKLYEPPELSSPWEFAQNTIQLVIGQFWPPLIKQICINSGFMLYMFGNIVGSSIWINKHIQLKFNPQPKNCPQSCPQISSALPNPFLRFFTPILSVKCYWANFFCLYCLEQLSGVISWKFHRTSSGIWGGFGVPNMVKKSEIF